MNRRPQPPPSAYKNFAIRAPKETHTRPATCQEAGCIAFQNGWTLNKEMLSPELLYAATHSRRRYTEVKIAEGHTILQFEAGQPCFAEHRVSLERPAFFYAGQGTPRTLTTPQTFSIRRARQFQNADDWRDSMQENLEKIQKIRERG